MVDIVGPYILEPLSSPLVWILIFVIILLIAIMKLKKSNFKEIDIDDIVEKRVKDDEVFNTSEFKHLYRGEKRIGSIRKFNELGQQIIKKYKGKYEDRKAQTSSGVVYLITFNPVSLGRITNPFKTHRMVLEDTKFMALSIPSNPHPKSAIIINPGITFFKVFKHYIPTSGAVELAKLEDFVILRNNLIRTHEMYEAESEKKCTIDLDNAYGIKKTKEETKQFIESKRASKSWDKEHYAR
jgi:hypothetical protein